MIVSKKKVITRATFVYTGEIVSKAVLFLLNAIVARKLGVTGYGIYIYGINLGLLLINFVDFGTNNFIMKKLSEEREKNAEYIWKIIEFEAIVSIISFVGLYFFINNFENSQCIRNVVLILFISIIFENLTNVFRNVLRAIGRFALDALLSILGSFLRLGLGLALYYLTYNIYGFSAGITISTLLILFAWTYIIWSIFGGPKVVLKHHSISLQVILKSCIVFAIPIIIRGVYFRIDSVLVKSFVNSVEMGLYNSVTKLLFIQQFLPNGLIQVVFPILANLYYNDDYDGANNLFNRVYIIFIVFFNFIQMVQYISAGFIIKVVYGAEFIDAVLIYKTMVPSFVFTSLSFLLAFLFISNNKVSMLYKYYLICLIEKIILVIALTLKYGAIGSAAAFLISEIIQFWVLLFTSFKNNIKFKLNYLTALMAFLAVDVGIALCGRSVLLETVILISGHVIICYLFGVNLSGYFKELFMKESDKKVSLDTN